LNLESRQQVGRKSILGLGAGPMLAIFVKVPVFYAVFPGDHLGILAAYTTQINPVAAAWLRWRLMDDASLAPWFVGPDCMLCKDSKWKVKQKMFDTAP
jgi:hypothetical protein